MFPEEIVVTRASQALVAIVLLVLFATIPGVAAGAALFPFLQNLTDADGADWDFLPMNGIAVNSSGFIHVNQFGTIAVFGPSGQYRASMVSGVIYPSGIAVNSTGHLFVADYLDGSISVLSPSGAIVGTVKYDPPAPPLGLAINGSDWLFATILNTPDVQVHDRNGSWVTTFSPGLDQPLAITVNSTDHVIVGGLDDGTLVVLDRDGNRVQTIPTGFDDIFSLATDGEDRIVACGTGDTGFRVFSPAGTLVGTSAGMPLDAPRGIAVTPSGRIVVGDTGHGRVHLFGPPAPTPTPSGPSPSFAAYPQSGPAPHQVQFLDYTPNAKEWRWDFGDGGTSTLPYPTHTYTAPGLYTVSLTVTDWAGRTGTKTEYHFIRVTEPPTPAPTPVANFTANATTGPAPLAVQFTDASGKAPFHWWWQFGDGSSSTDANPVHTYERTGAYTVNLTVWTSLGQATISRPTYVTVDGDPRVPEANFTLSRTSGPAPLYVRFTDTSTGNPTSWRWDFSGLAWTTTKNPSVVFRRPGTYTVTLTVRNPYGWSSFGTNVTVTGTAGTTRNAGGRQVSVVG